MPHPMSDYPLLLAKGRRQLLAEGQCCLVAGLDSYRTDRPSSSFTHGHLLTDQQDASIPNWDYLILLKTNLYG